ncbi:MAG: hypothetical protein J5I93_07580 [Pirellulaceae bacterium]|nr:hypothetical protein [Pirellulaceae bacterium]
MRKDVREARLRNWPLRQDGIGPWLLLAASVGVALVVGLVSNSSLAGGGTMLALLLSIWRVWLPVQFELGPRGILQTVGRRTYRISWREFRRYRPFRRGVLLLVDPEPSPLDAFRGLFIRYDGQKDHVLSVVDYYLGSDRSPDSTVSKRERPV